MQKNFLFPFYSEIKSLKINKISKKISKNIKNFLYVIAPILTFSIFFNSCRTTIPIKAKDLDNSKPDTGIKIKSSSHPSEIVYPMHKNVKTTYFYIGEKDKYKSGVIDNGSSAWTKNWIKAYGGIDDPYKRSGYFPEGFIPKENPFYFALPYNDVTDKGHKASVDKIDILKRWKEEANSKNNKDFMSYCKNKWIKIVYKGKVCYAQWEDVGPFETDDYKYVFGTEKPKNKKNGGVGLDISPACFKYLGMKDNDYTNWQFVDFKDVPDGPWLKYITISNPKW